MIGKILAASRARARTGLSHVATVLFLISSPFQVVLADWQFTDVSQQSGAAWMHQISDTELPGAKAMAGGVASGDYDRDGDTDLYLVTGDINPNVLLRNNSNGTFSKISAENLSLPGHRSSGPAFADIDNDGWQDLVVGGNQGTGYYVFHNNGDGTFADITAQTRIMPQSELQNEFSSGFGDLDGDGDLDLFITHWITDEPVNHLWINQGSGIFTASDEWAGIEIFNDKDFSFSPAFVDLDADGDQDLLVAADADWSQVLINQGRGRFELATTEEIDDDNGMGSAVFDYDNDGDLDWFVTSIWYGPQSPETGNRLYRNDGQGNFTNVTAGSGVREGDWGWGACAADFDNDGWQDLFHVNGWLASSDSFDFYTDPSRLFMNDRDGTFTEQAKALGIDDERQGRGVVCFDYDHDGDIDIFISNFGSESRLYRNDLDDNPGWLQIRLSGEASNPWAIGAIVQVTEDGMTQLREITISANFVSQNPLVQHFGLGGSDPVDEVRITWPWGAETVLNDVAANQLLNVDAQSASPQAFTLQPGISAAWYDPAHDGEGFMLEIIPNNRAVLYWFTYDGEGEQDWYIAVGDVTGRRIHFSDLLRISGGEFGPGFNPDNVTEEVVGSAAFTWSDCETAFMDWFIGDEQGRMELRRLSRVMGAACDTQATGPSDGPARLSGSWYDPSHAGEGYTLEVLSDGRVLVYWFSFDPAGARRWFFDVGDFEDGRMVFDRMRTTHGGIFGEDFDPATVEVPPWGSLELDIGCEGGSATYDSTEDGFGSGVLDVVRLTSIESLDCEQ